MQTDSFIKVENIYYKHILKNISMSFELGSIHGITGRSGVGKTTLLKILAMIMPPDSGMYYYGEKQVDIPHGDSFLDTRAGKKCYLQGCSSGSGGKSHDLL